jgi:hypothetical protein
MASHLAEMALRKKIAAKSDGYYADTQALGDLAWHAFGERNKSQIRNLESIANAATRVADILDFIKKQTGRSRPERQWRYRDFGPTLLEKFDRVLRKDSQVICESVQGEVKDAQIEDDDQRRMHILLCREFIRHVSAHYIYRGVSGGINLKNPLKEVELDEGESDDRNDIS